MMTIIRRNERSWAIELITKINSIADNSDLAVKRAGGESTISTGRGSTMFPDVILYGDKKQSLILQGWELKMPDVPIQDETFIKDAQRKAIALNLNSCLIWNFTYAVLYVKDDNDIFHILKQWNDTSFIRTRADVDTHRTKWEELLEKILIEVNDYFVSGKLKNASLGEVISSTTISTLMQRNKILVSDKLKDKARHNTEMMAYFSNWWSEVKSEYEHDESDSYLAYAKMIVLNWANRIVFAHIIKKRQNGAMLIDEIDYETTPFEANNVFKRITEKCDFFNVFSPVIYNEFIPEMTWLDFAEFSLFLKNNEIENLDQTVLQNILESSVNTAKREINGQFTTPIELAKILVRITVRDWSEPFLDCCCGTGTIPKSAIQLKKEMFTPKEAVESIWACDKYQYPLQIANISMTAYDTINLANRIFKHNALSLTVGEKINITNPVDGSKLELEIPEFGSIASNLPFVPFEVIPSDDKDMFATISDYEILDGRSDLYCYIALKISDILKSDGILGIITSNSWLGTNTGVKFVEALKRRYTLKQVHISGKGRWFKNADVVTTILILQKKNTQSQDNTQFFLWKKSLQDFSDNKELEDKLVNSALLGNELDSNIVEISTYSQEQMSNLQSINVAYNSLFHKIEWLLHIKDKAIPISQVFEVIRGSRRGWDPLFYPKQGEHSIESNFLQKILINARNVNTLDTIADSDAFCCGMSIEELTKNNYAGALTWINKFKDQVNGVSRPLPQVLSKRGMQWYELKSNEVVEFFTMMNPDKRLFFARFSTPSFINQRLIGLKTRKQYGDVELNHALLNSIFTLFYIEASGFGRGLGVLDINKDSINKCYILNPKYVSSEDRGKILTTFNTLKAREIKNVADELEDETRLAFEHAVLRSFGIDTYFDKMKQSLLSLQKVRATVKEK